MNGFTSKDERDSFLESMRYREVEIKYKGMYYHIERYDDGISVGNFLNDGDPVIEWKTIKNDGKIDAYDIFIKEKMFDGKTILEILDDSEIISSR